MTRKDKKNRTCDRCGKTVATPQKLREHLERKNPCRPINQIREIEPETRQVTEAKYYNIHQALPIASNSKSEIKNRNDRLPGETIWKWGSRLRKRYKEICYEDYEQPRTLKACQVLYDTLLQIDEEAYDSIEPTKQTKEIDQTNEEFARLSMITGDKEKSIIFREQNMGPALKRRAVAVHNAKVPRYHPDNGSDIRKMLESQRKPFQELLEKEFDKRGQFKFSLCSLTKFLVDDKPGDKEKDKKKNTRTDWLRNKQIIVYNRSEIDNYLSNAFEQIINQVEERGGKSNA
jgi:hypothetical protein